MNNKLSALGGQLLSSSSDNTLDVLEIGYVKKPVGFWGFVKNRVTFLKFAKRSLLYK